MTEIVMLVWLGDVVHNVSFLLRLLLVGCVLAAAVMWVLSDLYDYADTRTRALVWPLAFSSRLWR